MIAYQIKYEQKMLLVDSPAPYAVPFAQSRLETWEQFEQLASTSLLCARKANPIQVLEEGEIEYQEFCFRGCRVRWGRFLRVGWKLKEPFARSKLRNMVEERLAPWCVITQWPFTKALAR